MPLIDSFESVERPSRFNNEMPTISSDNSSVQGKGIVDYISAPQRQKSAWKRLRNARREAQVVQKSSGYVDKIVTELTQGKHFLSSTPSRPIAKFHRSEVVAGNLLGRGVFARVYDVNDFDLHEADEELGGEQDQYKQNDYVGSTRQDNFESINSNGNSTLEQLPGGRANAIIPEQGRGRESSSHDGHRENSNYQNFTGGSDSASTNRTASTSPTSLPLSPARTPAIRNTAQYTARADSRHSEFQGIITESSSDDACTSPSHRYAHLMLADRRGKDFSALRMKTRDNLRAGKVHYAFKNLTKSLLRNPREFHLAAAALLVEAKYLSKLCHPNIIKVVGLAMPGGPQNLEGLNGNHVENSRDNCSNDGSWLSNISFTSSVERENKDCEDSHDSYFLITERLADTLDRRIREWKREQLSFKKLAEQSSDQKIETWKLMMRKTSYALQISNALTYLHERQLLYRDLKPQNIGFLGDNETVSLFNFGLCREVDPISGTVSEDEVTALFGALSWKYTAVECFPQAVVHSTGTRVARLVRRPKLSVSMSGIEHTRHSKIDEITLQGLKREIRLTREQMPEERSSDGGSIQSAPLTSVPATGRRKLSPNIPTYNERVDVYSWAMVYYEMLTLNQPYSEMTQKEHLRKVAGPKGGQRPSVYQFELTPSMISLIQRSWDQSPNKRPTMKSVGRNLQAILKELENMINEEQKTMLKAETNLVGLPLVDLRGANRAKRREEKKRKQEEKRAINAAKQAKSGGIFSKGKAYTTALFSKNKYRTNEVIQAFGSQSHLVGPLAEVSGAIADAAVDAAAFSAATIAPAVNQLRRLSRKNDTDVDMAALEYEEVNMGKDFGSSEELSGAGADADAIFSSLAGLGSRESNNSTLSRNVKVKPQEEKGECNESHIIDDATCDDKKGGLPKREHNLSGNNSSSIRRPLARRSRSEQLERRSTIRMSRRTMRLSRASVWMMRRDVKAMVYIIAALTVLGVCGAVVFWIIERRATWLGVDLRVLKKENDDLRARQILSDAIFEACRHKSPVQLDLNKPLLFQGGALTPVDLECTKTLNLHLDDKLAWVTGVRNHAKYPQKVGFLNVQYFERPPPSRKKSKFHRKKPWKFFLDNKIISNSNPSNPTET